MSVASLQKVATGASPERKPLGFPDLLERVKPQIALALPKHLNADRMARIALTEFRKNPKLADCEPLTVVACVVMASQLGLELGVDGQAFLVPYYDKRQKKSVCTFIPGWKGYVDLVSRAGRASVWTGAVHRHDEFRYELGTSPSIIHRPSDEGEEDAPFTHVYAVGRIKGAEWPVIEVWSRDRVMRHLSQYNKVGDSHYACQNETNRQMYGRKVVLLQVLKYMPKSVELSTASELENAALSGSQQISVEEAVAGTFDASGYDVEGEQSQDKRIQALFDRLDMPGEIREEELARYKDDLSVLEQKLEAELAKGGAA